MKRLRLIRKAVVALGVLLLFNKEEGSWGFGGYVGNTWNIIFISAAVILIGYR